MGALMLAHHVRGEGHRPVVALHGFLGSGRNLGALVRLWTERDPSLRVFIPDLPGHGRSPPLPPGPTTEHLADAVLAWMDDLDVAKADFVGHSLGGRVALLCRARAPERAGRVALLDITPGPIPVTDTDRVIEALRSAPDRADDRSEIIHHLASSGLAPGLVEWLSMSLERSPRGGVEWRIDRERLAEYHHGTRSQALWGTLDRAPEQVALLRGGRSPFVSTDDVRRLEARGVAVETLEDAGHFVHVDATEAVVEWLERRLVDTPSPPC